MIGDNNHGREPVRHVYNLVESALFDPFADVRHEVIEACVRAFLSSDEIHNLYVRICCALDVFLNLLDDELGLPKFVRIEALSVQPFRSVI